MTRPLFSPTLDVLQKNLDLRLARHSVLSANVANAETPGYIAKDVHFEAALREATQVQKPTALQRTHARHLPGPTLRLADVHGTLVASPSDDVGGDRNTVSLDQEMGKLTMNTFHYNASTELLGRLFTGLRNVISEGGR
jgi:flagellar basal-body rod protein FlgB